jgi:NTP pyrophosphatase (non-canonical NTP hydrolase)
VELAELQERIRRTYLERDRARGLDGTFRWLVEEVGELARALRQADRQAQAHEVGDVLAWLLSVANLLEVDAEAAVARHAEGCPQCGRSPCACPAR